MDDRGTQSGASDAADSGYGAEHRRASRLRDWRLKAAIQQMLSVLPRGHELNYVLQRWVTKTLPITASEFDVQVAKARSNVDAFRRHGSRPITDAELYEFGAGWDLLMPLVYYSMGVEHQTVVDLQPLARRELVLDVAGRLRRSQERLGLRRYPVVPPVVSSVSDLVGRWGIDYRAPADARALNLPAGRFDLATSCDVLEHVPLADISPLLRETRRLLRPDGLARFRIDYQDHYWYFDASVSPYNFLRFSHKRWRRYNPGLHFQNRIRHHELVAIVAGAGFLVVEDQHHEPDVRDLAIIDRMRLHPDYGRVPPAQLAIKYANLTLKVSELDGPS